MNTLVSSTTVGVSQLFELVALSVEGESVYLPVHEARLLAERLLRLARYIEDNSDFGTCQAATYVAAFTEVEDAHAVADAVKAGLIKVREVSPHQWSARFRKVKTDRWTEVKARTLSGYHPMADSAYAVALYHLRKEP